MRVLVLSNHTAVMEQALMAAGHEVIVCLSKPNAALRAAQNPPYPIRSVTHWTDFTELAGLAAELRGRVDAVATLWEGAMVAAGFLRDLLSLPGQATAEAVRFTDKAVMKSVLHAAGVPVAAHRVVHEAAEIPAAAAELGGFPVVVKPLTGFGSTNTHVIRDRTDLERMRAEIFTRRLDASAFFRAEPAFRPLDDQGGFVVEQFVRIRNEYHCDAFWTGGDSVYQIPGRYNVPPLRGMGGTLGSVLLDPASPEGMAVAELAEQAARALGIREGFTHAEIYLDTEGRWLLGEIAARPGGGGIQHALLHAYHVNVPEMLGQFGAGEPVRVEPRPEPGAWGWAGPYVPPGRVVHIASRDEVLAQPGVVDASVVTQVGGEGGLTGSGQWGGLAGYAWLHGDTPQEVLALMDLVTDRYEIEVEA
ncbi:ATP-grasp domain-containing protein [Hamadaea sp. NPDC050747]|uniref:ATP-grasp domain-containing protein n=1 Tax=Hamadaea sp. NPDC050747 TaxID=3155789 RepID=UPI0033DD566C